MESPMKFLKYSLLSLAVLLGIANVHAQQSSFERSKNENEQLALRDFVQSKENVDLEEKDTNLELSGDVRFEYHYLDERGDVVVFEDNRFKQKYKKLRGGDVVDLRGFPISHNDWDVEFNFKVKYNWDKAWAAAHLQFDNSAGVKGYNDCAGTYTVRVVDNESSKVCDCLFNLESSPVSAGIEAVNPILVDLGDDDGLLGPGSADFLLEPEEEHGKAVEPILLVRNQRLTCKGSGEAGAINLKRAYMGITLFADGVHRLDIEVGRRKLNDYFVSEIEFGSRFDGIMLKYATALKEYKTDFYTNLGVFIIDERTNHFGWAGEVGLLNIGESALDLRYSIIDWRLKRKNRCFIKDALGTDFLVSQVSFSYNTEFTFCEKLTPTEFYGGFLVNHSAHNNIFTKYKGKKNLGWYAGIYLGQVEKKGDWAIDIEYMYVQAQAVSDCDVDGIGRGNILDQHFTDILILPAFAEGCDILYLDQSQVFSEGESATSFSSSDIDSSLFPSSLPVLLPRQGNANFKGARVELLYAITDNLSLDAQVEVSTAADSSIGGHHYYASYELEAIYAF